MNSPKHFNRLVISLAALASITASYSRAQDCQQDPQDCNASQVLSNFALFDNVVTSDSQPPTYCERYERTSLSEDGARAVYNLVYTTASGNSTPIKDTCTFQVKNNTRIDFKCAGYFDIRFEMTVDYVNGKNCFIVKCNRDEDIETKYYYLLDNPDSDSSEYKKCLDKINDYTGGKLTSMRDPQICPNVPPKP